LALKFTVDAISTVGLPAAPLPFVTLMLADPAVMVRFAVAPGEVSTTNPVPPGSLKPPPPAQVSVPDELTQQSPDPVLA
jgi:hypothetical protein